MKIITLLTSSVIGLTLLTACEQAEQSSESAVAPAQGTTEKVAKLPAEAVTQSAPIKDQATALVSETGAQVNNAVSESVQSVTDVATQAVENATSAVENTAAEAAAVTDNAVSQTQDTVTQAVDGAKSQAAALVDSANQTVDNAATAVNQETEAAKTTTLDALTQ